MIPSIAKLKRLKYRRSFFCKENNRYSPFEYVETWEIFELTIFYTVSGREILLYARWYFTPFSGNNFKEPSKGKTLRGHRIHVTVRSEYQIFSEFLLCNSNFSEKFSLSNSHSLLCRNGEFSETNMYEKF